MGSLANEVPEQANLRDIWPSHGEWGQWDKFIKFRKSIAYLPAAFDETAHYCSRFFQARRFVPAKAEAHFQEACRARGLNDINELYRKIYVKSFEGTAALYRRWTGHRDKRGLPTYMFTLSDLTQARITAHKTSSDKLSKISDYGQTYNMAGMDVRRAYVVHEHLTRFVLPLCTAMQDRPDSTPVTKQIIIADITGVSVGKIWSLRHYIREFSTTLSVNFPEVLDRVLIIGAPYYTSTLFNLVEKMVDPGTFDKLVIVSSKEIFPTLSKFIDIENIPKSYGGGFDMAPEMCPSLDKSLTESLVWTIPEKKLPPGPMLWLQDQDGSRIAAAVDGSNEKGGMKEVAALRKTV